MLECDVVAEAGGQPRERSSRVLTNRFDHPPGPLPARKEGQIVSEGHPFGYAQGKLSDSRQSRLVGTALPNLADSQEEPRWPM